MALDETMKTILIYVWRSKYIKITCDQASQRKWETAWSQVNEVISLEIPSLPRISSSKQKQNCFLFSLWTPYLF